MQAGAERRGAGVLFCRDLRIPRHTGSLIQLSWCPLPRTGRVLDRVGPLAGVWEVVGSKLVLGCFLSHSALARQIVAQVLDLKAWLREEKAVLQNIRGNRYAAFEPDSDGASDSDDEVTESARAHSYFLS